MWLKEIFRKNTVEEPKKESLHQKKSTMLCIHLDDGMVVDHLVETKICGDGVFFDVHSAKIEKIIRDIGKFGLYIQNKKFYPAHRIKVVDVGTTITKNVYEHSMKET